MIRVENISKSHGSLQALKEVTFEVNKGELFGLIGPDGAGKTTLFRILATLLLPDTGSASIGEKDVVREYRKIRTRVGYMPGRFALYKDLSVQENLQFFANIFKVDIQEHYEVIAPIYDLLKPFKDRRAGALSGGMKQKLALCCALIHKPELLLLDEPTTGVDPVSRQDFWDILQSLKAYDITILVSTPYMDEAALCERIALIQKGKILSVDTPENIRASFSRPLYKVQSDKDMFTLLKDLEQYERTRSAYAFGDAVHYTDRGEEQVVNTLKKALEDHELEVERIEAGVEDRFIELMKESTE